MKAFDWILLKQVQWACNSGITLIGSKGDRGRKAYTKSLYNNLFEPMVKEAEEAFNDADGNELSGTPDSPAKMQAVHSSSALGLNIFHYWMRIEKLSNIAKACGLLNGDKSYPQSIKFESKYPITSKFRKCPNIDVVIENSPQSQFQVYAIECKFSEAYSSQHHGGIDPKYLALEDIWDDLPNLLSFAKSISPIDNDFKYLHPAQLVKHALGLTIKYGKNKFRLLYLWYDCIGEEGSIHRNEIEEFSEIMKADGIHFHSLSYQELIGKLATRYRADHEKYINYISSRYL